jgi:hypothetical protein
MTDSWMGFMPRRSISVIHEWQSKWRIHPLADSGPLDGVLDHLIDAADRESLVLARRSHAMRQEDVVGGTFLRPADDEPVQASQKVRWDGDIPDAAALTKDT